MPKTLLYENELLWNAMKESKYRDTLAKLREKFFTAEDNFDDLFLQSLNLSVDSVHAEAGTLWIYNRNETNRIHPKAVYGGKSLFDISLAPGEGVAGKVIEQCKPELIIDCQSDSRWAGKVDKNTGFQTRSMICVPLVKDKEAFGCIQIINKIDGGLFDNTDFEFVITLANELSDLFVKNKEKLLHFFNKKDLANSLYAFLCETDLDDLLESIKNGPRFSDAGKLKKASLCKDLKKIYKEFDVRK